MRNEPRPDASSLIHYPFSLRPHTLLAAAVAATALFPHATLADRFWKTTVTTGNWSTVNNWSNASPTGVDNSGPPGVTDTAYITQGDIVNRAITLTSNASFVDLRIGNVGGGTNSLSQTQTPVFNMNGGNELLGFGGNSRAAHTQSTGSNTFSGSVYIGYNLGSTGAYNLSGSGSLTAGQVFVGNDGTGTFNQSGGQVHLTGYIDIGENIGSVGAYLFSAGTFTEATQSFLGFQGSGAFIQSGGKATFGDGFSLGAAVTGTGNYTLSGTGVVTVSGSAYIGGDNTGPLGTGLFNVQAGSLSVTSALTVWNTGSFTSAGTVFLNSVNNAGKYSQAGSFTQTGNFTNSGTATLGGTQAWSAGTTFTNSGTAVFQSDAGGTGSYKLALRVTGGTVTLNSAEHLASLAINASGSSFAGTIDLKNNYLILGPGNSANTLRTYLRSGSTNGTGLKSTSAAAGQGIGYMDATSYNILYPSHLFQGQALAGTETVAKLTWQGDADLSGFITMADYAQITAGFLFGNFNGTTTFASWYNGDFNYDGKVDFQDFALIDNAFLNQSGPLANDLIEQHAAEFGAPYLNALAALSPLHTVPVPEPASLALVLGVAPLLLRRRAPAR